MHSQDQRILEAMILVIAQRGYEQTTVSEVTSVAGVSAAEFDLLFAGKEQCFLAAYDLVVERLTQCTVEAYDAEQGPWPRKVFAAVAALLGSLTRQPQWAEVAIVAVTAAGPNARQRHRDALSRFARFLEPGRDYADAYSRLTENTPRLAIGGAAELVSQRVRSSGTAGLPSLLPDVAFTLLTPYMGPEAAAGVIIQPAGEADATG